MVQQFIISASIMLLVGCGLELEFQGLPQVASDEEKMLIFSRSQDYIGVPYLWGGDDSGGIDCSGLVLSAIKSIGYNFFANANGFTTDITADDLFQFNTYHTDKPSKGDLVFFDLNENGVMDHVAVFAEFDSSGALWVVDAYSVDGFVSYRTIDDYQLKIPQYGELILYAPSTNSNQP